MAQEESLPGMEAPVGTVLPVDEKYVVFKRSDWENRSRASLSMLPQQIVKDAVVIRRQDLAAPPILDAYANFYLSLRELLQESPITDEVATHLAACDRLATYFHDQATAAWETNRKWPD